ncbi:MAG: acyltransferase [Gammaproteobacteria bacterium]|jgi:peptidoglycan/LPS O-acetylase OafA/YrhL|nr:acyltransferase [Gammaproteobacteria bacterium]MBT4605360.1 acyltransferase [Thiotrichales bacterium]MBT3968120.1 acyltransferase [Gammaproteobacteria bacterium]MBT4081186.1 acyltransferase [Gammaproteobacteria bacterium]MBT4331305.1 acyltransferase [Gammaproteobacteria bacterium]
MFHYRREIDGLRAIAILPVIFFHAGFQWFSGGYVGVDIFFVISGYLISSIIFKECTAGTFTLQNFYERRARRILPALFLVTASSIPLAWCKRP